MADFDTEQNIIPPGGDENRKPLSDSTNMSQTTMHDSAIPQDPQKVDFFSIDSGEVPSFLLDPEKNTDQIKKRFEIARKYCELRNNALFESGDRDHNLLIFERFKKEPDFWYYVLKFEHNNFDTLRDDIPKKERRRDRSFTIAIQVAEAIMDAREEKLTDELTGVWNKEGIKNFLENLKKRPRRDAETGILFFDVDKFKTINDTKGHLAGDKILQELTAIAIRLTRNIDMIGRFGGDEFAIVLPNLPIEKFEELIKERAEALRVAVQNELGVTLSIGATALDPKKTVLENLEIADSLLYSAKKERNKVCFGRELLPKE